MVIDAKTGVQQVDVEKLRKKLADDPLLNGSAPEIPVDNAI
jgi:hypothetical protein